MNDDTGKDDEGNKGKDEKFESPEFRPKLFYTKCL